MTRCINIDWLEVYCIESFDNYPHDASYFRRIGYTVKEREYGTRVYSQMFTVYDTFDEPLIEIRRDPMSSKRDGSPTVLDPMGCHIRLHNRTCYFTRTAEMLQRFLEQHGFSFSRISRIDLCLDFIRFDTGDDPKRFISRYLAGRYTKINQANISAHGKDMWDGRDWNSISWGARNSMVTTKLYNKTLELREARDKPYIRQAWAAAGLVDNFITLQKHLPDGTTIVPDIWRLEFSINSSVKRWFVIEDRHGREKRLRSIHNTLDVYYTREQMLTVFASLVHHYFFFKHYQPDTRKDRCRDKKLFRFTDEHTFYEIERPATSRPKDGLVELLIRRLSQLRDRTVEPTLNKVVIDLIDMLRERQLQDSSSCRFDQSEIDLLRRLVAYRVNNHVTEPVSDSLEYVRAVMEIERTLFTEQEAVQ